MKNPYLKKAIIISLLLSALFSAAAFYIVPALGAAAAVVLAAINIAYIVEAGKRYRAISDYSERLGRVVFSDEPIDFSDYSEGELAILNSEIQKLIRRLRDDARLLKKDKKFLADSIADISHQLKTPLTSVGIITEMLNAEELSQKRRIQLASQLKELLSGMTWQIDSLLKMSKLDANMIEMHAERIKAGTLLKKALDPIRIPLELKGIEVKISGENAAFAECDLNWTAEAVLNILKNCMEHCGGEGELNIRCDENALYTQIEIFDTGSGIDEKDIKHLFERFYQGENPAKNSYGIGLALAKVIITSQNGELKAENRRDRSGAVFTVRFYKGVV